MKMNYFVVGTNNMDAAIQFYDGLFDQAGFQKLIPADRMTYWLGQDFAFAVAVPFNEEAATNGNGTMVGFSVGSVEEVQRLYHKALELGGTCEGEPGSEAHVIQRMSEIWITIRSVLLIKNVPLKSGPENIRK